MSFICEFNKFISGYCGCDVCYCECCDDPPNTAADCYCDCACDWCCDPDAPECYHCEDCDCGDCDDSYDGPFTFACECYPCQKARYDAYLAEVERQRKWQAEAPLRERLQMQQELFRMIQAARDRLLNR